MVAGVAVFALMVTSCARTAETGTAPSSSTPSEVATATAAATVTATATATATESARPLTAEPTPTSLALADRPTTVAEALALDRPLNVAHAGGDLEHPHSTPFAFSESLRLGADILEMDVQLSGDGVLVVQHDDTVDKTTEQTGPVADRTAAELAALDNAYWFSPACWPCQDRPESEYVHRGVRTGDRAAPEGYDPDDFAVATFRELAERFDDIVFDIEIKGAGPDAVAVAQVLAAEINDLGLNDRTVVVSFDDEALVVFEALAPDVITSPGLDEMTAWILGSEPLVGHAIVQVPPEFSGVEVITAEFVARAGDEGVAVWAWPNDAATQENLDFYAELIGLGVDGVIAGRPSELRALLAP